MKQEFSWHKNPIIHNGTIGLIALFTAFLAGYLSMWSSNLIMNEFTQRVVLDDALFRILPYYIELEYVTDLLYFLLFVGAIYYIFTSAKALGFYYTIVALLFYIVRAFFNILTPMARPLEPDLLHGVIRLVDPQLLSQTFTSMGMFPSGHIGASVILFLIIKNHSNHMASLVFFAFLVLEAVFMIASRGHYSIDVVGGIMLALLIYIGAEKYLKKYMQLKKFDMNDFYALINKSQAKSL